MRGKRDFQRHNPYFDTPFNLDCLTNEAIKLKNGANADPHGYNRRACVTPKCGTLGGENGTALALVEAGFVRFTDFIGIRFVFPFRRLCFPIAISFGYALGRHFARYRIQ